MKVDLQKIKSRTIFEERKNVRPEGFWPVALDFGYSAVKGVSPNALFCFPSYAKKETGEKIMEESEQSENSIRYWDEDGTEWIVGELAQMEVRRTDATETARELFGRNRYDTDIFHVITRVGLALGMRSNAFGECDGTLILETGLPPSYAKLDSVILREALAGKHDFTIQVGNGEKEHFHFVLPAEHIRILDQPTGTLMSLMFDNDGNRVETNFLAHDLVVFDPGFGTCDVCEYRNGKITDRQSFDTLGMKGVFEKVIERLQSDYHVETSFVALQRQIGEGYITHIDYRKETSTKIPLLPLFEEACEELCDQVIERLKHDYNAFDGYDYLVVTGGLGAIWYEPIKNRFAFNPNLTVLNGVQNDDLPMMFSNARGYYLFLVNRINAGKVGVA